MELTKLINNVNVIHLTGEIQRQDVSDIVYNSNLVKKNSVFVAIKGFKTDGHKYILDAINKGAIAIILEDNNAVPEDIFMHRKVAKVLVSNSRRALAEISSAFYKEPSSKLKMIGITGTNGKTTTTYIIKNILSAAGNKTGLIGTISNYIGDKEVKSSLTTPEANDLQKLLFDMVNEGCSHAVMEVSSHSLTLNRAFKTNFEAAIFTNITIDHLDFHETFENYLNAKKMMFDSLNDSSFAVYNIDDKNSFRIIEEKKSNLFSYGKSDKADFKISDVSYTLAGTLFNLQWENNSYKLTTPLVGEFNAYNAAAAFASTVLLGIDPSAAIEGIKSMKQVPGRFEVISKNNKTVIVDYSHTPDSLEQTLTAINKIVEDRNPVYTVFGCGGDRDKSKRPDMGKAASELSKKVFVTSDNPRTEDPHKILEDIIAGIQKKNYEAIENREEAIKNAITSSEENAIILIAGKGHETYQEINGARNHFSDKETALKYLE
jgi:UDP-N-acetylmuramoyl-L-alanyl-D-glutamate--2,6-diaminopimelate ligase